MTRQPSHSTTRRRRGQVAAAALLSLGPGCAAWAQEGPTAAADAPDVTQAGATRYSFTVVYSDPDGVYLPSLGAGDLAVIRRAGAAVPVTAVNAPMFGVAS